MILKIKRTFFYHLQILQKPSKLQPADDISLISLHAKIVFFSKSLLVHLIIYNVQYTNLLRNFTKSERPSLNAQYSSVLEVTTRGPRGVPVLCPGGGKTCFSRESPPTPALLTYWNGLTRGKAGCCG